MPIVFGKIYETDFDRAVDQFSIEPPADSMKDNMEIDSQSKIERENEDLPITWDVSDWFFDKPKPQVGKQAGLLHKVADVNEEFDFDAAEAIRNKSLPTYNLPRTSNNPYGGKVHEEFLPESHKTDKNFEGIYKRLDELRTLPQGSKVIMYDKDKNYQFYFDRDDDYTYGYRLGGPPDKAGS